MLKISVQPLLLAMFLGGGILGVLYYSRPTSYPNAPIKIMISKTVDHPALNETVDGIIAELQHAGYEYGYKKNCFIRVESAQANPALANQIASLLSAQQPTIFVGVGTMSAQSLLPYAQKTGIPLVFSSVTDPVSAALVSSPENQNSPVSGVSNFVPLEPQLHLFKEIQPSLRRLGILYNPGEPNSRAIIQQLTNLCPQFGLELIVQTATKTADIPQAVSHLVAHVDAIFVSNDNTALSALDNIIATAQQAAIPVYVSDTDAVRSGAVAALGPNQKKIGRQTGRMIVRLLQGASITAQPIEFPETTELYLNPEAARRVGIEFTPKLTKRAHWIYTILESPTAAKDDAQVSNPL